MKKGAFPPFLWSGCALVGMVPLLVGCSRAHSTPDETLVRERPPEADLASAGTPATSLTSGFHEVGSELGLDFRHQTGARGQFHMPEVMSGGAAVFDYDNDGDLDIYFVNAGDRVPQNGDAAGSPNRLYRQEPDGRFVDVTEASGLGDTGYGMGVAVADVDNDGDVDVYVTNFGPDALYRNRGDGTFRKVTGRVLGEGWSTSAAFLDYDRDGHLDLYVTRYVEFDSTRACAQTGGRPEYCGPTQFPGEEDLLYHNLGGGQFEDASRQAGISTVDDAGLGVVCADFDDDGWMDIYVANDADPNNLWINQRDGTFLDEAVFRGAAFNHYGTGEAGMGVTTGDADGDGDLDLFMTHLIDETNTFYRNLGAAGFEDATRAVRLGVPSLNYTGFGTAFFDFDNDGDLDVGVANGAVKRRPSPLATRSEWFWNDYAEPNLLLENQGDGRFVEVAREGPVLTALEVSRALVPADLDRDGDLDVLITNLEGPPRVWRNDGGNASSWIELRLLDPERHREALGARVTVVTATGRYVRHALPPGGYLTGGHPRIHLGLGPVEEVESFRVHWPDGVVEDFPGSPARRVVELRKGEGQGP